MFFSWTPVQIISPSRLYIDAFEFARDNQLPDIYDSLYVVLARILQVELWTDDRRLIEAVKSKAPWVRGIADYQTSS
jgi:predicted nucleic acid-binding protein